METQLEWHVEKREVASLKEWDKNPRKISEEDFLSLKVSITARGFHDVLKIDTDGTIISGHQRRRALLDLGIKEINVMVPSRALTSQERDIIAVESNRHRGTFDFDILANNFNIDDLVAAGFDRDELFGGAPPAPDESGKCKRCVELKEMVEGHQNRTGHNVMEKDEK